MTLVKYQLNNTDGVAITPANSGLSVVTAGGSATATYRTGAAFQGATGGRIVSDGTNAAFAQAPLNASATQAAFSIAFKIPASLPAADTVIGGVYDTSGAIVARLLYRSTGTMVVGDKSGTYSAAILSAVQAVAGTYFRFELVITNLSTTAGTYSARAYNAAGTQVGSSITSSTSNTGTTAMSYLRFGQLGTAVFTADIDSVQTNDGATTEIGALTANTTPPTINTVSADQTFTSSGVTVNVTASATPAAGDSIANYTWSFLDCISSAGATITPPTITNASSANASFTLPATKGRYRLQVTATDASGNTSAPSIVRVFYPDSLQAAPIEVVLASGWTGSIGSLVDASDSTKYDSGAPTSNGQLVVRLSPITAGPATFSLNIRDWVDAAGGTQKVELLDSNATTVRKDWGAVGPGTVVADEPAKTLTTGEIATVTGWNELCLRFTQV